VSIRLLWRRGLLVLAGAAALAVAAPAVASAATVSTVSVTPASVPAAMLPSGTDLTVTFSFSGTPTSLVTHLPAGLLSNGTLNGGACLVTPASDTPPAACQIGTVNAGAGSLYLVAGPNPSTDLAGLEVVEGGVNKGVADVTSRAADGGLDVSFSALPSGLTSFTFTGSDLRMPTNCPGENITAGADGQTTPTAASPAFTVTGCSSLAYNPTMSATVKADSGAGSGAEVISSISQPGAATESATKSTTLGFGTSLTPNAAAVAACFVSPCQVGTATATSPLLPSAALSNGTVTLGGNIAAPTLTITFPLLHLSLVGAINLGNNTVTFANEPDFPISSLNVDVTGPSSGGKAFTTSCAPATLTGAFTPWDGNAAVNRTAQITYQGCGSATTPGKPIAVGVLTGLGNRHPKLKVKAKHGVNAPNLKSVAIKPSSGLTFKCVKSGKSCKGLSIAGAKVKSAKVARGQLVVTLKKPAAKLTLTAKGPLLRESKALQNKVLKHKIKTIKFTLKVKDAKGSSTTILLKLKS
jgi:hypothetical protein